MKNIIIVFITLNLVISCSNKEKNAEKKQERIVKRVNDEIVENYDKIILIANIEKVPTDKVKSIIKYYFRVMYDKDTKLGDVDNYQKLLLQITKKSNLSIKKVSSIIFSYIYEMRTNSERSEEYINNNISDDEEPFNEVYNPR